MKPKEVTGKFMTDKKHLFCFGLGFTTITLGQALLAQGWKVSGTTRNEEKAKELEHQGFDVILLDTTLEPNTAVFSQITERLGSAPYVINSSPPNEEGDIFVSFFEYVLTQTDLEFKWFGYLSTIGVYGEHHGAWIDETAELFPVTKRSKWRHLAEKQWQNLASNRLPLHIFRLPGIYGNGRNQMVTLLKGKSRRLVKKGQVFNRIHVEDIAQTLQASMANINKGVIYNIVDDMPCAPQDVVTYGAKLLNMEPPPIVLYEEADLSPMARSFYGECKRVKNEKIKKELRIILKYPSYKEGLSACLTAIELS